MNNLDVTELLQDLNAGNEEAFGAVMELVYKELRSIAENNVARRSPAVGATSLVHEAYLRMVSRPYRSWENRRHFYAAAARAMRDVVVERARRATTLKRHGAEAPTDEDPNQVALVSQAEEILSIDLALDDLREADTQAADVVLFRYFVGLNGEETAGAMGISAATVDRRWSFAKAWLRKRLEP